MFTIKFDRWVIQRYQGTAAGWVTETDPMPMAIASRRLNLRRAVRGHEWMYRLSIA